MHTLIISQRAKDIVRHLNHYRDRFSDNIRVRGKRLRYKLELDYTHEFVDPDCFGGALSGSPNHIVANIVGFAEKIALEPSDVIQFQVIFMFHQTSEKVIKRIIKALTLLNKDTRWRSMQDRHQKPVLVPKVVMLSCESALDLVNTNPYNPLLGKYHTNCFVLRRLAGLAFHFDHPLIVTNYPHVVSFSTGDPIRGGIVLDPFAVFFKDLAYIVDQNGNYQPEPGATEEEVNKGSKTSGKIYTHDYEGNLLDEQEVLANQGTFPLIPQ